MLTEARDPLGKIYGKVSLIVVKCVSYPKGGEHATEKTR